MLTGKLVRVNTGMSVNDMNVTEIRADRVVLAFAGETEELPLRVATGRGTVVAQPQAPAGPAAPAAAGRPTPVPGRTIPALTFAADRA